MCIKYHNADQISTITNDLYLASYLHSEGCILLRVQKNDRRRVSFILCGGNVLQLREQYRSGRVTIDLRSFRDSLIHIRRLMDAEQRSASHEPTRELSAHL